MGAGEERQRRLTHEGGDRQHRLGPASPSLLPSGPALTPAHARGVAPLRTRPRRGAAHQALAGPPATRGVAPRSGTPGASALGDRTAIPRAQRRIGPRSFRRPVAARVGQARGADGPGVRLAATRTRAPRGATAHVTDRAGGHHRDSHRPLLRHTSALSGHHAEIAGCPTADLTK